MRRVYSAPTISPTELKQRIARQFSSKALAPYLRELLSIAEQHELAVAGGAAAAYSAIDSLLTRYESVMPSPPAERFMVDAWMIQDLAEMWSQGTVKLPRSIIPIYGNEWLWQRLPWIQERDRSGHRVYGLGFKGRDQLSAVQLIDYPWLCHELGHGLFAACAVAALSAFADEVEDYCRPILRKLYADSPDVRAITKAQVASIQRSWLPRNDQQSWFHEIAVDIFALWSCGPAFLATMVDVADTGKIDPFLTGSTHPPYALRVRILIDSAHALGWEREVKHLQSLSKKWEKEQFTRADHNQYAALTPKDLADRARAWAFGVCRQWKIPRCDQETLRTISARRSGDLPIETAIELIISAWLVFEQDRPGYPKWELATLRSLSDELNGNA